jgi:PhnB protein
MTSSNAVPTTVPAGYTTVTPWIISHDTRQLLDFVRRAFNAEELARIENPDGSIGHAEFRIGDAIVMAFDANPEWPRLPAFLRLYVADADAVFQRAIGAGAEAVTEPTTLAFGDRVGRVRDPLGNVYWLQARLEELPFEEMQRRAALPEYEEAMAYVQSADIPGPTEAVRRG